MKHIVKRITISLIYISLISMLVSCHENTNNSTASETKQIENHPPNGKHEQDSGSENNKEVEVASGWGQTINEVEYKLDSFTCEPNSLVAPYYTNNKVIIFVNDSGVKDQIVEFSRLDSKCKILYETIGIGNLVGIDDILFWTEYDTNNYTNVDWEIKSYNLKNDIIETVRIGGSHNDTPTPALSINDKSLNWIEYQSDKTKIISQLMEFNIINNDTNVITEAILNESTEQKGDYFIIQKGIEDGILLYKTIFDGNKRFDISLYNNNPTPKNYIQEDGILDFTANGDYFVYTGEGYLKAKAIANSKEEISYLTNNQLTIDSPILINEHFIIFRYAMNDIYIGDLQKEIYFPITKKKTLVSKPIDNNGLVSFATRDAHEITTFHVIDTTGIK